MQGYNGTMLKEGDRVMDIDFDGEPCFGTLKWTNTYFGMNWCVLWEDTKEETIVLDSSTLQKAD